MNFEPIPFRSHSDKVKVKKDDLISVESFWKGHISYDNSTLTLHCRLIKEYEYKYVEDNSMLKSINSVFKWVFPFSGTIYSIFFGDQENEKVTEEVDRKMLTFSIDKVDDINIRRGMKNYEIGFSFAGIETPRKSMLWYGGRMNLIVKRKHKEKLEQLVALANKRNPAGFYFEVLG